MSKIDELIKEKCPNGVKYLTLGETCDIKTGAGITKKDADKDGIYPIISGGIEPLGMYNISNRKANTVTIARAGGAGYVNYINKDFYLNDKCFSVIPTGDYSDIIDSRFLYFVLKNKEKDIMDMKSAGSVPTINTQKVSKISIPVPPLEIQQEIVGMLNSFTELEAELEAELTKRKQQYEHYRDHLLSFENISGEGGQVEWLTLGDIAEIGTGSSNTEDAVEDGQYPFFVRSQEPLLKDSYEFDETAIITAGDGVGVGKVFHFIDGKYALHQRAYRIHPTKQDVNAKYLFQLMRAKFYDYISKKGFHSSVSSIRKPMLINFPVPLPRPEIQERIVYVLDNFDAVCNDLNIGLPAEIEARQKQYEYYRDRLLSFNAVIGDGTERERERGVAKLRQYIFGYANVRLNDVILSLNTGLNPRSFFRLNTDDATNYYITIREIHDGNIIPTDKTDRMNNEALRLCNNRSSLEAGDVLFSGTGTIGETAVITATPKDWNIKEGVYSIKPDQEFIIPMFLRYALMSKDIIKEYEKRIVGGTVKSIPMKELKNISIYIPTLEKQQEIIDLVDRFNTLCSDIKSGLPAEIKARHKQYEYYRDKLLTFQKNSTI